MEQINSSTPVSQPSMMELGENKKDHHLSSWTENDTHTNYPSSWESNPRENLDILNKKRKTYINTDNNDTKEVSPKIENLDEIDIENDMNPKTPSVESTIDLDELFEEEIHFFRRIFTDSDIDLQQTIDFFLQYGNIADEKCFSKPTKIGYITYIAFTNEEGWLASNNIPADSIYKIKSNDKPRNSSNVEYFYRLYLRYPIQSSLNKEDIANFFDSPDETESISPNPDRGYIIVYLKTIEHFFKYLNKSALHKNNKSLSILQSLCGTNDKSYTRIWLSKLPSKEIAPKKLWSLIKSIFKIDSESLYSGKDRDSRNRSSNRIFFWIHTNSDAYSLIGKSIDFKKYNTKCYITRDYIRRKKSTPRG